MGTQGGEADEPQECPACYKQVRSVAALNKHLDSECTSIIANSQPSRSKTPTPSQSTKKPKTPSRSSSKPPKKTPKNTPLAETSGNGNLNSFFKKASTQKPPSSSPTPSASQGKSKKDKRGAQPSSSAPPGPPSSLALDDEEYQKILDESRAMHEYEEAQRRLEAGEEPDSSPVDEVRAQRERWEAEQPAYRAAIAAHTRILQEGEARSKAEARELERKRTEVEEAQRARRWQEAEEAGRRIAEEAEAKARAKAEAKAAKAEAKTQAKAEKARQKAEAKAAEDSTALPAASQCPPLKETPVPPPASQKRKRGKSVPPSSSAPPPASQKESDSEAHAPPAASQKRKREESVAPSSTAPPPASQKDSDSESTDRPPASQKRKHGKSAAPPSSAPPPLSQNGCNNSDAHVLPPASQKSQKRKRGKSVSSSSSGDVPPPASQNDSESETHTAPAPSQSKKSKKGKKSAEPLPSTALSPSQTGSGSDSSAQAQTSNPSPTKSQNKERKEARILPPPSVLSPSGTQGRQRSRSKSVPPSSVPDAPLTQNNVKEASNEPPSSTPTPTASQMKKAKKRAAKKDKKLTVLEKSSAHSRDGQEQSNVINPMVAPFTANPRKKAAGPSRLSSVQSVDLPQGEERQSSPVQKPRRGSFVPTYDGRVAPIELYEKLTGDQLEWMADEEAQMWAEDERGHDVDWTIGHLDFNNEEDDETRVTRERAEEEERQRQQAEEEERERARREEDARVQAVLAERQRVAEEERQRDQAHAALMAQGHAQIKAQKAEAKAKKDAERMRLEVERDEFRLQQEDQRQRQEREVAESKARVEEEERQRKLDEEEERLRIEAEAEAEAQAEGEAEAEALALQNAGLVNRTLLDDSGDVLAGDMDDESARYDEMFDDAAWLPLSQQEEAADDDHNTGAFEPEASPEPAHGYVDEQDMQIKLPQPTTMDKLQQSGTSYSKSSPYSCAPWSSAPKSTVPVSTEPESVGNDSSRTTLDLGPAPSQDYDSMFDNSHMEDSFEIEADPAKNDSQGSTNAPAVEDNSQESAESWQGIQDEPATAPTPTAPAQTPAQPAPYISAATATRIATAAEKRALTAQHYNSPASKASVTPFRAPMSPSRYTPTVSPTSSQKRRRIQQGWMPSDPVQPRYLKYEAIPFKAPRNSPVKGVLKNIGRLILSAEDRSPKSRRIAYSKHIATMKRIYKERCDWEQYLDDHCRLRFNQMQMQQLIDELYNYRRKTRYGYLTKMGAWTPEQAMRHLEGRPPRRKEHDPLERTVKELHELETGAAKVDEDGEIMEDKDKPFLYALRESILDSNVGAASLYLAKMLKMQTEPRRICEVLCATAARCVPVNPVGDKPFVGNPMSNHYAGMASDCMNIVAFSDSSDELVQEQLLATTVQLAQASKTSKWKSGLKELMEALDGMGEGEFEVPKMLREGSEEDVKRKGVREKAPPGFVDDSANQGTVHQRMKSYMPPTLGHLSDFMKEDSVAEVPAEDFEMEEYVAATPVG